AVRRVDATQVGKGRVVRQRRLLRGHEGGGGVADGLAHALRTATRAAISHRGSALGHNPLEKRAQPGRTDVGGAELDTSAPAFVAMPRDVIVPHARGDLNGVAITAERLNVSAKRPVPDHEKPERRRELSYGVEQDPDALLRHEPAGKPNREDGIRSKGARLRN